MDRLEDKLNRWNKHIAAIEDNKPDEALTLQQATNLAALIIYELMTVRGGYDGGEFT